MSGEKLCLGTVQLGMNYGINNAIGRMPTNCEAQNILKTAVESGIDFYDTASAYGVAEEVLGAFNPTKNNMHIVSKLPSTLSEYNDSVIFACKCSLKKLNMTVLDGYLLHNAKDLYNQSIMDGLRETKILGLTKNIGVSIYDPLDAIYAAKLKEIDYIQIPYNAFDKRLDQCGFFELSKENHKTIFARSAFLQGLLVMNIEQLPSKLSDARTFLKEFGEISARHGFSKLEAAFLYSYCHAGIDYVTFGVDTVEQLECNLRIANRASDFKDCFGELYDALRNVPERIIIPSLW